MARKYDKEYAKKYYEKNRLKLLEYNKEWMKNHPGYRSEYLKEYTKKYSDENRKKINERARDRYASRKEEIYELLGGAKCCMCGFSDRRALQIDHVNGCGNKNRIKNMDKFYKEIIAVGGVGYQILCANCNWIKRFENEHERN